MLKTAGFIVLIELTLLLRRSYEWLYPLSFFLIVLSLFPLAISEDPALISKIIPGCIWITALFASLLSIQPLFSTDKEEGSLEQWLISQTPLSVFIMAKLSAQWLVTGLPLVILSPLLGCLFHLSAPTLFTLCLSLLLGTPILTLVGSFGVALTLGLRQQGVLLGLLILPLTVPVLIFAVLITQQAEVGLPIAGPLSFLAGLCLLSMTCLPFAIASTIRISMDE